MHPASRSLIDRWIYAAKVDSWPKLLVPTILGQALGVAAAGRVDPRAFVLGLCFTICQLLFVVFLNDWGDRRVDRIKRQMFPEGCSPKTIPDAILPGSAVLTAGVVAGLAGLGVALYAELSLARAGATWSALALMAIFLAYTFWPLRLNYRGGGEWLEGLGVGLVLPWFHLFLQSGESGLVRELWLLPGFCLLALASAVASGLSDEQSDRRGGKRTYASEYGNRAARALVERLGLAAALVWAVTVRVSGVVPAPVGALVVIVVLVNWRRLRKLSPEATTNAFDAQRAYKRVLHQAQWRSATLIAVILIALTILGWRR
ncbi:prenyltransferase [Enhygromyxa salina]|uniref:prenyltransferase n=1 Tax=Enhygromyxa salina TaxID=215803 RepID=UPI0021592C73|nr:prenyltransferase [Enhygromyxa salina]